MQGPTISNPPIPLPRPAQLGGQAHPTEQPLTPPVPASESAELSPAQIQEQIQDRIDGAFEAINAQHEDPALSVAFPDFVSKLNNPDTAVEQQLDSLKSELQQELERITPIRAHLKVKIHSEHLNKLINIIDSDRPVEQKLEALNQQLAEAHKHFGSSGNIFEQLFGDPPPKPEGLEGVQAGVREYIDALHNDFHLKPRPWH